MNATFNTEEQRWRFSPFWLASCLTGLLLFDALVFQLCALIPLFGGFFQPGGILCTALALVAWMTQLVCCVVRKEGETL